MDFYKSTSLFSFLDIKQTQCSNSFSSQSYKKIKYSYLWNLFNLLVWWTASCKKIRIMNSKVDIYSIVELSFLYKNWAINRMYLTFSLKKFAELASSLITQLFRLNAPHFYLLSWNEFFNGISPINDFLDTDHLFLSDIRPFFVIFSLPMNWVIYSKEHHLWRFCNTQFILQTNCI